MPELTFDARSATGRAYDRALVERAREGDRQAFDLLALKYQGRLMRFAMSLVRDRCRAEDLVQEAFIRAYRALPGFRAEQGAYTWLYQHALSAAKLLATPESSEPVYPAHFCPGPYSTGDQHQEPQDLDTPESLLECRQAAEIVLVAVNSLPLDLRAALLLREVEGLDYQEISAVMQCPVGTISSRIFRAREAVAEQLHLAQMRS